MIIYNNNKEIARNEGNKTFFVSYISEKFRGTSCLLTIGCSDDGDGRTPITDLDDDLISE